MRKARLKEQSRRRDHYTNLIRNQQTAPSTSTAPKPKAGAAKPKAKAKAKAGEKGGKSKPDGAGKKGEKTTNKRKR